MAFCTNCGAHITQGTNFCPSCGMAQAAGEQNTQGERQSPPEQGPQGPGEQASDSRQDPGSQGFNSQQGQGGPGFNNQQGPGSQGFNSQQGPGGPGFNNQQGPGGPGFNSQQGPQPGYGPWGQRQEKQWFSIENDIRDNMAVAVLSYPFSIIMLFVILCTDLKNSRYAKFHLNQGLLLTIFSAGFAIVFSLLIALISALFFSLSGISGMWHGWGAIGVAGVLVGFIWAAYGILSFVLLILGMVNAGSGKMKRLPLIGKFDLIR